MIVTTTRKDYDDQIVLWISLVKLLSPHTPRRLWPELFDRENDRWQQAAAILDGYGDGAGDYVINQLRMTVGDDKGYTFWTWADLANKVEELQRQRLRPN
jgi:hypothetical protein